jgi:putative intracellular protease/amidase
MAQDHQEYVQKEINPILEQLVTAMLLERPDNVPGFILKWLNEQFLKVPAQSDSADNSDLSKLLEEKETLEKEVQLLEEKLKLHGTIASEDHEPMTADSKAVWSSLKVLIVATSAAKMGDHDTGAWSEEICGPYYVFKDAGCDVIVCSINGGDIPIDAGSLSDQFKTENDKKMIEEGSFPLKDTKKLADMDYAKYDIIFFAGGHGTCVDFPTDAVGEAVSQTLTAGKVVGAVCHGPMALINAKTSDGEPVVKGKKVACFTDVEENQVGLSEKVPFLLEAKLKELGATVEIADPWSDNAVQDGKLVTGQNPQSSVSCAKLSLAAAK